MTLQIGDKVSFVDEKREGIVTGIINTSTVKVEIEDGFEIPVLIKNLIKIAHPQQKEIVKQSEEPIYETAKEITVSEKDDNDDDELISPLFLDGNNVKKRIFLAFEPHNQKDLVPDTFNVYLCNATAFDVLFCCYMKLHEKKYEGLLYDAVSPNAKYFIKSIEASDLDSWQHLRGQFLFFSTLSDDVKEPLDKEIYINTVRFFQKGSYVYMAELQSYCIPVYFYEEVMPKPWDEQEWEQEKIEKIPVRNIRQMIKETNSVAGLDKKHVVAPYIAEVDLHIEQLADNFRSLSNYEMLNMQLNYFAKCMDAAIVHKFKKITFIHGVGEGVLKEEIHKIIRESYEGVKIQDAPFKKYGMGATEVLIPFNLTL